MATLADLPSLLSDESSTSSYDSVSDVQAVYRDPRFRADLREYYASKGTGYYDSDDELIDRFFADGNWRDLNTLGAVDALNETATQSDRMKLVTARLQQVWDRQPAFWQEGGRGLSAIPDIATALVLDPTNLIGGGSAAVQGAKAARATYAAGKGLSEAVNAGMRSGALRGAAIEGGINAAQEAVVDTALQQRNVELGLQDEVSQTQTALGAGAGALIGGVFGGGLGALAGRAGGRQAATQAEDLVSRGLTRPDIGTMTPDQLAAAEATTGPLQSPARAQELATQLAEQQRLATEQAAAAKAAQDAANDPEIKYAGHLEAIDRAIAEHRRVLDDYNKSGFDKLDDADPNKAVYKEHLAELANVTALREQVAKLKAEEEQIRDPQGSNILADDATAIQRRVLFEQRFSQFRNALEQYQTPEQINAAILERGEAIRTQRNMELDAEAAKDAPKPAKAKVDPQGKKAAAAQPQAAPAAAPQPAAAQPQTAAPQAPTETPPSPAAPTQAGEAAAAPPAAAPGAAAAPTPGFSPNGVWANKDFDLPVQILDEPAQAAPDGKKFKKVRIEDGTTSFVPEDELKPNAAKTKTTAPPARPDGIVITKGARENMAKLGVDEEDFINWYKDGAKGWDAKDKATPNQLTSHAPGAYKKAIRKGLWVGNAKVNTPEEQPNRLAGLLNATDPYASNFRNELEELINDTLRYTAGVDDPAMFREVFEALSTDDKFKSNREDFMLFLDESYKVQGLSANMMEGLSADVREGKWELTPEIRKQLNDKGYLDSEIDEMRPSYIRQLLAETGETTTTPFTGPKVTMPETSFKLTPEIRQQLRDGGLSDDQIDEMRPSAIRQFLAGEAKGEVRNTNPMPSGEEEDEVLKVTEKKNLRELAKNYREQGMPAEEAMAAAQQKVAENRTVTNPPLPRDAEGKTIERGRFKNQRDRQTTQAAIRREAIMETAGRNWNNNRIADMLKMGIATKRIPTTEEYWQTRGDTFVSESIGTAGLRRGIDDKYLDPNAFDLVSARIQGDENVKANKNAKKISEEYGKLTSRFNERINNLLVAGRTITDLTAADLKQLEDIKNQFIVDGMNDAQAQAAARAKIISRRTPRGEDATNIAKSQQAGNEVVAAIAQKAINYAFEPKSNVDGMADILGVKLLPKPPKDADEATSARMKKERTEDPAYNDVLQILNAGKKAAKKKAAQEQTGGPEIIQYAVKQKQSIYRNGQRVEVTSGTAFYDAKSMRSFASFEEAVAAGNGIVPVTEADKKSYLRSFLDSWKKGGDVKSLRDQLEKLAAGDFSFAKKTPAGLVNAAGQRLYIMLARKGDRSVRPRKLSKAQYEAAKDGKDGVSALLGKSDINDFDIRYTTAEDNPKSDAAMWKLWDSATPVNKMDEVASVYGNRSSQNPISYNAYAQKTVTSLNDDEADALVFAGDVLKIGGKALSYRNAEEAKAAAKAGKLPMYVIEAAENKLAYSTPVSAHKDGMLGIAKHMAALNRIREREAPMGFVMPTAKREESVAQLRSLFEGYDRNTVTQLETMLRRLAGPRREGPIFKALEDIHAIQQGVGGQYVYRAPNAFAPENSIRMATPKQVAELNAAKRNAGKGKFNDFVGGRSHPVANLAHELFHWAWHNILNPSDRVEFIEGLSRQLYDKDGNILPLADQLPPTANALESINEIGANLFTQWFMRNRSNRFIMGDPGAATKGEKASRLDRWLAGLDRVFESFKEHILGVIERYFHHQPLDPALETKFAKILPDDRLLAFKDGRGTAADTFGAPGSSKYKYAAKIEQRYKDLKFLRRDFDDAVAADSDEGVVRAAINISNYFRSIGLNSKKTGIFYPIKSWYKVIHERNKELTYLLTGTRLPDDIIDELDKYVTADGKPKSRKDMDDADVGDFVDIGLDNPDRINPTDVFKRFSAGSQKPTLDDRMARMSSSQLESVARIIREIYFDSRPFLRPEGTAPEAKYSLKYLFDQLERSFEQKHIDLFNTLPKGTAPNILGEIEEAASDTAKTRAKRSANAADKKFGDAMAEILDAKNYDYKANGTEPDSQSAANIRDMSVTAMAREWPRVKGTPRGTEIMSEVKRRLKAEPYPAERVAITKAMQNMKAEQLNDMLFTALRDGGPDNAKVVSQVANELHRRAANEVASNNNLPKMSALIADVREAISRETEDNQGVSADIGIPANARATVREALSYVTDRNPEHAYAARTMLYRLYNLMGKTVRATVEDSHLMSMADLSRLAGVEPGAGATGMVVDFRSPVFKSLRRDVRRFAIGLNKQTSTPIDLMHEIGHIVIRGVLSDADRANIYEFFEAANDDIKKRVIATYGPKYGLVIEPEKRLTDMTRRSFLKGTASIAGAAAVPKMPRVPAKLDFETFVNVFDEISNKWGHISNPDDIGKIGDLFLDIISPIRSEKNTGIRLPSGAYKASDYDQAVRKMDSILENASDYVRGNGSKDLSRLLESLEYGPDDDYLSSWFRSKTEAEASSILKEFSSIVEEAYKKRDSEIDDLLRSTLDMVKKKITGDAKKADQKSGSRQGSNQGAANTEATGLTNVRIRQKLAEEWFAESWAQWASERVARGDIQKLADTGKLTDISLRGKVDTLIDRVTEYIAYLVNGLIGRDDVKQMFRRLTFYGDMFDTRRPKNVADVYGDNFAVPAHIAADYVDESLFRNKVRLEQMQDFVRGTEGQDGNGNPVIVYHATPNGYKFSKDKNPDVVLNASSNGKYGPGTYVTFMPSAAEKAYAAGTPRSLLAMIEDADLADDVADDLIDLVETDLNNVRKQIRFNIGELTTLRDEAEKLADAQEGDLNYYMVREDVGRLEKTLAALYRKEKSILDTLERSGITPNGVVLPLVHNAKRLANFSEKMRYEPDDPFVTAVVDRVQSYFPATANDTANAYATFSSLGTIVTGRSLYDRLITMATKNGIAPPQAKVVINNALKELGYDGIRGTFVDRVSREGIPEEITHEGAVIFDTARLKHVDAEEFNPANDRLYLRALSDTPVAPMGQIVGAIIEGNIDGFSAPVIANAMEAAEAAGVAPRFVDALRSMVGKRNLTQSEFKTKANAATLLLGSQSKRMAQDGMNWLSSRYQDFFPSVSVEFGKQFYPLLDVLRSLPGADSASGRWIKRSFGTMPGVGKRLGKQPAAYTKIVAALRRGDGTPEWAALSERERQAAMSVRSTFTAAREALLKSGDSIGKRENYFPQIWNAEKIAANREAFIAATVRYFETERIAEGAEIKPDELRMMAERIAMKLTDEEADKYFPPQIRSSNAKAEHLDYSRIFQLEKYPGHLKDFEEFLEDDLEAIAVKYIDGAARRLVQNERFGNSTHMFNDYMLAATEGVEGIVKLLATPKVYRKEFRALEGGEMTNALFELEVGMPFQGREDMAREFAEGLVRTFQTTGRAGAEKALMELSTSQPKTYVRRVEAILGALEDFGGQPGVVDVGAVERAHQSMKLLVGQPLTNPSMGGRFAHNMSKNLRAFNSITLLSFATLTSLTDIALPIIRSGEFKAWYTGLKKMASDDPEYRQLIRNVGVAIESEVHQHLSTLYGTHSSKHANAFFNATMLTPWTNVQRKIAAATGFEAMKIMQQKAFRTFKEGKPLTEQPAEYKTAHRFLTRYGMSDFLPTGAMKNISIDQKMLAEEDVLKLAIVKFADEAIFAPNPNDIPLWAQTPLGSIVFQFKAYPIMMGRMARWALDEARQGNYKPVTYMATIAPGLGAASMAIKDVVQMRGGEENNEAQVRSRNLEKFLGYDEKVHGDKNDFMGWYLESMLASGGFGFLAELLHDISSQVDNGAYGKVRVMSAVGGPSVGTASAAFDVAAGIQAAAMGGSETGSKERTAVREVARRIPVAGGVSSFREGATDAIAGPKRERSTGGWNSDWKGWE